MANAQFIPVILPNENIGAASGNSAPGLGHAGFLLVDSGGNATFYEYGPYQNGTTDVATTNPLSPNTANVRAIPITGTIQFDGSGNITQASLQSTLDQVFGTGGFYAGTDPGVVVATPFSLTSTQYGNIVSGISTFKANINAGGVDATYGLFGLNSNPNCINFLYAIANAGSLVISSTQNSLGVSIPTAAADNILAQADSVSIPSYEYFSPSSWNASSGQSNITQVSSFNTAAYEDVGVQFENALENGFGALGTAAWQNIKTDVFTLQQINTLSGGLIQKVFGASDGDQLTETTGGTQSPVSVGVSNSSGKSVAQLSFNVDGSDDLNSYISTGTLSSTLIDNTDGTSQEQSFTGLPTGVSEELTNYLGANLTGTLHDQIVDYSGGTSTDVIAAGLPSGDTVEYNYYTGLNDTGTLYQQMTDYTNNASLFEAWNPTGSISSELEEFSGLNGSGTNTENVIDWAAGGSQEQLFTGLGSGISEEVNNYLGANDTGTLHDEIVDYTAGNSTDVVVAGLPSGVYDEFVYYTGQNEAGTLYQESTNYTAGNSQLEQFNPTGNIAERYEEFTGANDTGTDTENILDFTNGFSQEQLYAGMPSGVSSEYSDYTGANLTGTLLNGIVNYSAGTSTEVVVAGLPSNVSLQYDYFSEVGALGQESYSTADLTNGETMDITYLYSGSTLDGSRATFYSGSSEIGTAVYSASGEYIEGNGDFASYGDVTGDGSGDDNGGGDGGYDGGYELTANVKTSGTNIGEIAQSDASLSPKSAVAAENARFGISALTQLLSTGSADIDTPFFEGAKWNSKVITWSLATSPGTAGSPFSGYMGTQYAALVQQAFQAWGAASGLTFVQVADSSNSDIRLGWGSFDTASSGVVGYTSYQDQNGQLDPNVIIRLENPSQDSLVSSATGTLTYSGTQANLYQVIAHEIGHALGLSDNVDPSSVMYYQAAGNSGTLDSNDIEGVQMLYGGLKPSFATASNVPSELAASEAPLNSMLQQMIQSAAAFNTQQSALTSFVPPETVVAPTLAAPQTPH